MYTLYHNFNNYLYLTDTISLQSGRLYDIV
jgi:hypothetical protein